MADMPSVSPKRYKQSYTRFGGVDFSANETQVKPYRSPDACNMISDEKFFPVKRPGYRTVQSYNGKINGLHLYSTQEHSYLLIHAGTSLYVYGDDDPLGVVLADAPSESFLMKNALHLLDGNVYSQITETEEGLSINAVTEIAFVPTTSIGRLPSGGDGTALEAVNLLTRARKNSFKGDGAAKVYQLDRAPIDPDSVSAIVDGSAVTAFTVNATNGTVSFSNAPSDKDGIDNVIITFSIPADDDQSDTINKCRVAGLFGGQNDTRVFVSGNPDQCNVDWQSGLYDPTYFPDTGYTRVGSDASAIMGYARQYDTQIVIKESNKRDATQWLRTFDLDSELRPKYALMQGAVGSGAVSMKSFATLGDEPLFLASDGVYAVAGTNVARQRAIQKRGGLIELRLASEDNLDAAIAAVYDDKYYLAVNNHMYVADGRQAYEDDTGSIQYEWYYWEGVPVTSMVVYQGSLYFGTESGALCIFKKDPDTDLYSDDGQPYPCWWTTNLTDFDDMYKRKTVRDVAYKLMPFTHSQYSVWYRSDKQPWEEMRPGSVSLFDWNDVWFDDFSFVTLRVPEISRTRRKARKVEVFQVMVRNDTMHTGLGILGLEDIYVQSSKVR